MLPPPPTSTLFPYTTLFRSGMSVLENVSLPMVVAGTARKQAESRARDLLDLLGIADKASKTPGVLSGGQRQRLSIRSEEHTSELQSQSNLVCRLLLEKKKNH